VEELAALSPIEYDQRRQKAAERLGVRVSTLDQAVNLARKPAEDIQQNRSALLLEDPAAWSEPVDGARLLNEIVDLINRHVILPEGAAEAIALWILHTHAHDSALISPVLAVTSPAPECGKTTLLSLLGALVPRPISASNITYAAVFRAVAKWRPTLLIDEADTFLRESDQLQGVLNSGHNRSTAYVIRSVGDDHEPQRFPTWSPKAIALIGSLPAALSSRAIHIELRRKGRGETVSPLRIDRLDGLEDIRRRAWKWAQDHVGRLKELDPEVPATLSGRAADNWRHLLAIADTVGEDWPQRGRSVACTLAGSDQGETAGIMLLGDVKRLFDDKDIDKLTSKEIVDALAEMEDRPWPEWNRGNPISPRGLAKLLKNFGIVPTKFRASGYTPGTRGYELKNFEDAFARYLVDSAAESATAPHPKESKDFKRNKSATVMEPVADYEALKAAENPDCGAVADEASDYWEDEI
jgi:putative DNA primase/helicase